MEIRDSEYDLFKRFAKIEVGPSKEFIGQEMSQHMYKNIQDGIADAYQKILDAFSPPEVNDWAFISAEGMYTSYLVRAAASNHGDTVFISDPEEGVY